MKKTGPLAFFSLAAGILLNYYHAWPAALILLCGLFAAGLVYKPYARQIAACLLIMLAGVLYADIIIKTCPNTCRSSRQPGKRELCWIFPWLKGRKAHLYKDQ